MIKARSGLTLFEVAISMAIISVVVISTMLALTAGLKSQQMARMQMYAAARAMQLVDAWGNLPFTQSNTELEVHELGATSTEIEHDIERRMFLNPANEVYRGWGGVQVVPPAIAKRLDSDNNEIAQILAEGGQLYYFPNSGFQVSLIMDQGFPDEMQLGNEGRKLIFAVRGKPQANALQGHPLRQVPTQEHYAFPPQPWHARTWFWNTTFKAPAMAAKTPYESLGCTSRIFVTDAGRGYTAPPRVTLSPPAGSGRVAKARAIIAKGLVTAIQITDPGAGYTNPPTVTIESVDGNGSGAVAEAGIYGYVDHVTISKANSQHYTRPSNRSIESVSAANGAAGAPIGSRDASYDVAVADGGKIDPTDIVMISEGVGYLQPPAVSIGPNKQSPARSDEGLGVLDGDQTALVDYAVAEGTTRPYGIERWTTAYPSIDWGRADAAFWEFYNACYHFRIAGPDGFAKQDDTWLPPVTSSWRTDAAAGTKPMDRSTWGLTYSYFGSAYSTHLRNPTNRFSTEGVHYRDTVAGIVRNDQPAGVTSDYNRVVTFMSRNYDVPADDDLRTGEGARYRVFLETAQRLVHHLFPQGAANGTEMTSEMVDYGANRWILPHPPRRLSATTQPWAADDQQVYPPSFKIMALSYLAYAAHLAASRDIDPARGFTQTGVAQIRLTSGGAGYSEEPQVVIQPPLGYDPAAPFDPDLAPALARARISGGAVIAIDILDAGAGYDPATPPEVTINRAPASAAGGGATGAAIVGWSNVPGGPSQVLVDLEDYAKDLNERLIAWAMRYASADPYDWGAPRPLNRQIGWDFPLLQYDMFPTGDLRPSVAATGTQATGPGVYQDWSPSLPFDGTMPNEKRDRCSGDLDLILAAVGLDPTKAPYSVFDRTGGTLAARWLTERTRPGWRRGNPVRTNRGQYFVNHDYSGYTGDADSRIPSDPYDIDREWKIIAPRQPHSWGPARGVWGYNATGYGGRLHARISEHINTPGSAGDHDNSDNLWYSWGDHSRFNLTAPFAAAERCRELVFWSVDWLSYEDAETAAEAPFDARAVRSHSDGSDRYDHETRAAYGEHGNRFGGPDLLANYKNTIGKYVAPQWSDRDGNGSPGERGMVRASVRMKANLVASFAIYDGRLIGGLRR